MLSILFVRFMVGQNASLLCPLNSTKSLCSRCSNKGSLLWLTVGHCLYLLVGYFNLPVGLNCSNPSSISSCSPLVYLEDMKGELCGGKITALLLGNQQVLENQRLLRLLGSNHIKWCLAQSLTGSSSVQNKVLHGFSGTRHLFAPKSRKENAN